MSIHAQLYPEARAQLSIQKRNSTISSIIISLLVCTLIGITLYVISMTVEIKNNEVLITRTPSNDPTSEVTKPTVPDQVQKKPTAPTTSATSILNTKTYAPISVPVPDIILTEPSLELGNSDDFEDGIGNGGIGDGLPGIGINIPANIQKRCSKPDRIQRLTKEGGKASYDSQVVAALRWLNKTQARDGSWQAQHKPVAMTGLALLCYLGHCETPSSAEFGEAVQKAIIYLINVSNQNDGKLTTNIANKHWCYEHAIATYALAEAYTLCKAFKLTIPGLEEAVLAAGNHIIRSQHSSGGWDYAYDTSGSRGGDTSIVCWHLQAIKACKMTKIKFNDLENCAKKGIKYLEGAQRKDKETIGYGTNGSGGSNMTPGGALCFQQWGKGNRSFTRKMIQWIAKNNDFDFKTHANLYMHYYASQAMINAQGKTWATYNEKTMTNLAENQQVDGSWALPAGAKHGMSSRHYATCLSILMMEVYYRFLPSS